MPDHEPDYKELYHFLYRGIFRIVGKMEDGDYEEAKELLIALEQEAEEQIWNETCRLYGKTGGSFPPIW